MRVLIVKTSSLGDVIHTLPALTDAGKACPDIRFDWVVEQAFAEIPAWHPLVDQIIPVAIRRWRKQLWRSYRSGEFGKFYQQLRAQPYDYVLDAQGLIKSAAITRLARGVRCGLDANSARESLASLAYQRKHAVAREQHAVTRVRQLFAAALDYPTPTDTPDYGIDRQRLPTPAVITERAVIFLHGTTWTTKHWPETYWRDLAQQVTSEGYQVLLPWGNSEEQQRAERIAADLPLAQVLPKLNIVAIAGLLARAQAVVAVDTGLGHLAAALAIPTISIYGPTNPNLTGTYGANQTQIAADFPCAPCLQRICTYPKQEGVQPPCFGTISPNQVWQRLESVLAAKHA